MTLMQKVFWSVALIAFPIAVLLAVAGGQPWTTLAIILAIYVAVGLYDLNYSPHTLNRLYPVVAYIRYALEHFHTEIH